MTTQAIPEGYKKNAAGYLVPVESIKEIDLAEDDFVRQMIDRAKNMAVLLQQFKEDIRQDFQAYMELAAEKYDASMGGAKGNVELHTFDHGLEMTRTVSDLIELDSKLHVAKSLIDECLREWTKESDSKIRTLVESAFQVDKKGQINKGRILGLRNLEIDDPKWKRAMEAISDSIRVVETKVYFRFYEKDEAGKMQQIILDFSGV